MARKVNVSAQIAALERSIRSGRVPSNDPVYYVYLLIDPRTGAAFYVGKGKGKRHKAHVEEWKKFSPDGNGRKLTRITEILRAGEKVGYEFPAEGLTERQALRLEEQLVYRYRATITNSLVARRNEAERSYQRMVYIISRIKPPTLWVRDWVRQTGKMPTEQELDSYVELFTGHLRLRDACRRAVKEYDAYSR